MCGGGSSTAFSSALDAPSVSRSASSMSTIWNRPVAGRRAASCTTARISLTEMVRPSGVTVRTSAWVAASTVRQCEHCPQPLYSHSSAAANARAATDRPDPGGPVNSHAWVIAADGHPRRPRGTPRRPRSARRWPRCWPMTSSKTAACGRSARSTCSQQSLRGRAHGRPSRPLPNATSESVRPALARRSGEVTTEVITSPARAASSRSVAGVNCQMCCSGLSVHHLRPQQPGRQRRERTAPTARPRRPGRAAAHLAQELQRVGHVLQGVPEADDVRRRPAARRPADRRRRPAQVGARACSAPVRDSSTPLHPVAGRRGGGQEEPVAAADLQQPRRAAAAAGRSPASRPAVQVRCSTIAGDRAGLRSP